MKKFKPTLFVLGLAGFISTQAIGQGDNPTPTIVSIGTSNTVNCLSPATEIGISINGWVSGFTYQWNTGQTDSIISVSPNETTTYFLQISHQMLGISEIRGFEVKVENDPIVTVESNYIQDKTTCLGTELIVEPIFTGGYEPYSFQWDSGSEESQITLYPRQSSEQLVTITDACGTESVAIINIEVEDHDPLIAPESRIYEFDCFGDELIIKPKMNEVSGGVGYGYLYSFDQWATTNDAFEILADNNSTIPVEITDGCMDQVVNSEIQLIQRPLPNVEVEAIEACENEVIDITLTNKETELYYWDGETMHTEYEVTAKNTEQVKLKYLDRCGDPHQITRSIEVNYSEADFDYDAHESNGTVELFSTLNDDIEEYTWSVNGNEIGTTSELEIDMDPGSTQEVELTTLNKNGCIATTRRMVTVRDNYSIPSAFSPNNDGKNDYFRLDIDEQFLDFKIEIFDRWGQLIYQSNDQYFTWSGEDSAPGLINTYVYQLIGTTVGGGKVEKTGTLTVVN